MNVVFLDYDGVVNTAMWTPDGKHCLFNYPHDGSVNNFQAVQWLSEFCQNCEYSIVVSSTWRTAENYQECLINGGLRDGINILGRTPFLSGSNRGAEIKKWIDEHPGVENYVILDDDVFNDFYILHGEHVVQCDVCVGITESTYESMYHKHMDGVFAVM